MTEKAKGQTKANEQKKKPEPYRASDAFMAAYKARASQMATREPEVIEQDIKDVKGRMAGCVQVVCDFVKDNDPRKVNRRPFLGGIPVDPLAAAGVMRQSCVNRAQDYDQLHEILTRLENELKVSTSWRK